MPEQKLNRKRALEIVLKLAQQNILEEEHTTGDRGLEAERLEQEQACEIVEDFIRVFFNTDVEF